VGGGRAGTGFTDFDLDYVTGFHDFTILAAYYGRTDATLAVGDANNDGVVGFADFVRLAAQYGTRWR
jgi:hypothetical protein